jgi:hypothetical protein
MPRDISKHVRAHALWQVNRSNAFEISWNPWKHTDRAVFGYRLLQRCGFRPGSARNNKSARSPRAMSHNPGSDICLHEVKASTHCHVATMLLCAENMLGLWCFLARSSCDQQGCTPQRCRFLLKTSSRLRSASEAPDGRWIMAATCPDCALLSPNGQDLHHRRPSPSTAVHRRPPGSLLPCWLVGAPGLRS